MADTYTQVYIQVVFAVQGRASAIKEEFRNRLEQYICGIVRSHKAKVYAIYCNPDHIHILISINPNISISELVNKIKSNSSKWINEVIQPRKKFNWQAGYGAFSYAQSALKNVIRYIENQEEHHRKTTFKSEYEGLLDQFEVAYAPEYLFEFQSFSPMWKT